MGVFKRLHRITIGRIEAFLSRVEDPELLFPVLVKEMQEQLSAATEAEAKATATLKHCQRDARKHSERIEKLKNGALQALKNEDETTARVGSDHAVIEPLGLPFDKHVPNIEDHSLRACHMRSPASCGRQ